MATVTNTIKYGDSTVFLMANSQAKSALFGNQNLEPKSIIMVALVTDALRWNNEMFPSASTLQGTSNYLLWLCGKFQLQAQSLTGGGTVIPIPSGGNIANPLDFLVSLSTPIATGDTSKVFPQFIGYNMIFNRGGIAQAQINDGLGSSYFIWNKVTGLMKIFGAASLGELFSINPV